MKKFTIILTTLLMIFFSVKSSFAQDQGEPAMKTVALYSAGGAGVGAALGIGVWLIDPLSPSADFNTQVLTGMAIGSLGGAIFGVIQLQKRAVIPGYQEPEGEFDDQAMYLPENRNIFPEPDFTVESSLKKAPPIPLFQLVYQF